MSVASLTNMRSGLMSKWHYWCVAVYFHIFIRDRRPCHVLACTHTHCVEGSSNNSWKLHVSWYDDVIHCMEIQFLQVLLNCWLILPCKLELTGKDAAQIYLPYNMLLFHGKHENLWQEAACGLRGLFSVDSVGAPLALPRPTTWALEKDFDFRLHIFLSTSDILVVKWSK